MKNKLLILISILALFLRVVKLDIFPYGFHADEVRVGWNSLSILKTGKDDRGNTLSLYYNTFGDFRPTGIFYLTIPSITILGRTELAVRLPSAFLGAISVIPLYFLLKELKEKENTALLAGLLLATSPWHISVSRATSEVVVSLFFILTGLFLLVKYLNGKRRKDLIISSLLFILSYFFYHTARILIPAFVFVLLFYKRKEIIDKSLLKPTFVLLAGLGLLTFIFAANKDARGRFSQVSIFNDLDVQYELTRMPFEEGPNRVFVARLFHNKPSTYIRKFINEYASYFSSDFFLDSKVAKPDRYTTVGIGILTYVEYALLILGLVSIAQKRNSVLPLMLLLVSPFAAALTTEDAPNLHRAFYMVVFTSIIAAYGFNHLLYIFKKHKKTTQIILYSALIANTIFYLHMYYVHNRVHIPLYRNIGAKELAVKLNEIQDEYDKIILTNIPDDPYPWIAFFTGRDPENFNKDAITRKEGTWSTDNFVFTGMRCPSRDAFDKPDVNKLLVVDAEGCATESELHKRVDVTILETIKRPDETEVYTLWSMK